MLACHVFLINKRDILKLILCHAFEPSFAHNSHSLKLTTELKKFMLLVKII